MSNESIELYIINSSFNKRYKKIKSKSARKSASTSDQVARWRSLRKHQQKKQERKKKLKQMRKRKDSVVNQASLIVPLSTWTKEIDDHSVLEKEMLIAKCERKCKRFMIRKEKLEEIEIENQMMFLTHSEETENALMDNMEKCTKRKKRKKHSAKPVNSKVHAHHIKRKKVKQRRKRQRATKFAIRRTSVVFSKHVKIPDPNIRATMKTYNDLCCQK